jgi:dolichol kinase
MPQDRIFLLETKRQAAHLMLGMTISVAVYFLMPIMGILVLAPLMIALILLYAVPKKWPNLRIANHLITHFERDNDAENFPFKGSIWYGLGIIPPIVAASTGTMPLNVACAIIAVLSIGDSTCTWVGKFFGRIRIGHKSLEGFLTFAVLSALGAMIYTQNWPLAIIFGFAGAILELYTIMDDNFFIPFGLTIVYYTLDIIAPNLIGKI